MTNVSRPIKIDNKSEAKAEKKSRLYQRNMSATNRGTINGAALNLVVMASP